MPARPRAARGAVHPKVDRRAERISTLANAVARRGVLHLRDAADLLGVSEMTVRRDITGTPDRFGYLGGYIVPRPADGPYEMAQEIGTHAVAKEAICSRAAALIEDQDTVFIDCGTTTPHLARHLRPDIRVTVVCYALNIAAPLAAMPNVRLIVLGGAYNASSASFEVDDGLQTLGRIGINKAFISAGGVHAERGVSCSNFHEVAVKQAALRTAVMRCLLADGSKLGKVRPAPFAPLAGFDTLITTASDERPAIEAAFTGRLIVARGVKP